VACTFVVSYRSFYLLHDFCGACFFFLLERVSAQILLPAPRSFDPRSRLGCAPAQFCLVPDPRQVPVFCLCFHLGFRCQQHCARRSIFGSRLSSPAPETSFPVNVLLPELYRLRAYFFRRLFPCCVPAAPRSSAGPAWANAAAVQSVVFSVVAGLRLDFFQFFAVLLWWILNHI
jgi:hypothetical protein